MIPIAERLKHYHLSCVTDPHCSTSEIKDQDGRTYASAPENVTIGDWLLKPTFTDATSHAAIALIVRVTDASTGKYRIIGQAILCPDYGDDFFPSLSHQQFSPEWKAEDLFLLEWIVSTRAACRYSRDHTNSWLKLRVCVDDKEASYFHGPSSLPRYIPGHRNVVEDFPGRHDTRLRYDLAEDLEDLSLSEASLGMEFDFD